MFAFQEFLFNAQDVGEVKWIGLETAKRLHRDEEGVIFIDVRDRRDYVAGHIADAYCTPLPEIIVAWLCLATIVIS